MKGVDGKEFVNLPVDWQKTKQKGKIIYNFNFHTEGYFFGWIWFKESTRIRNINLWYFIFLAAGNKLTPIIPF